MFAHFRRHQKTLWIFISAGVIISFVWYFNPSQRYSRRGYGGGMGGEDVVGTIFGEPVHRAQYLDAYHEAVLHYLFTYGEWPQDNEANRQMHPVEREARNRVLLARKLKDYKIEVSDQATADWIANAFQDRQTKTFHQDVYQRFVQQLQQHHLKENDLIRYARNQVGITHLAAIAGAPGRLVTPQQAEQVYRAEHEKVDTKVALFPLTNYVAQVQLAPLAIATYYTNNIARYRLPERIQLSYVNFPATNYNAKAEQVLNTSSNLTEQIDAEYLRRGPSFYNDLAGHQLSPEAAKQRIRQEVLKEAEMTEARRDAFAFATALEQVPVKTNSPNPAESLENLAAAKGYVSQVTEPFSEFSPPRELRGVPEQFNRAVFQLTPENPRVEEPIEGEDGFYVVALKHRVPSETPALETIRAQVTQDYQRMEELAKARAAASSFLNAVTNGLASGQSFAAVAKQNGVQVADVEPFSKDTRDIPNLPPMVNLSALRSRAFDLAPGHVSSYLPTGEGGFIVYVEKFIPATDQEVKQGLPQFRQELERREAIDTFNGWFAEQMQLAQLHLPGDKTEQETE